MHVQIDLEVMFDTFYKIQQVCSVCNIKEISVKQHQIDIRLDERDFCYFSDVLPFVEDDLTDPDAAYVATGQDGMHLIIEINSDEPKAPLSMFNTFVQVIRFLADKVCKCPSLEFAISGQYLKFYLDKPGITLEELTIVEQLFNSKCTLELGIQRPYILFINENLF